jgi:GntR family transcriptional regulator
MQHSASFFHVAPGSAEPIYLQLVNQVQRQVVSGLLAAGDMMPSVREVAQAHAVNPMTVSKAYAQLEAEGVLERRRGVGMVVAGQAATQRKADRLDHLRPTLEKAAREAAELEIDAEAALALFEKILTKKNKGKREAA